MTCRETCTLIAIVAVSAMLINGMVCHIALRHVRRERNQ